ncbi:MAG: UTRA domain-containing protein [Haliea sp.]|jgi:GntR family transcriptional regulator|nr:UTRA domain-containing protein [Haliea sp.]
MEKISEIFSETQLNTLAQDIPTPLYFRLYSLLKNAILDGTIENGAQMPTEQQLAETFAVSRITAKRAMDELAAEELVERRRGKGTHVIYEYSPQPVKAPLIGMLQEIESMARHSDVKVLECKKLIPPASVREALGLEEKDKALHLVRVRSREGQPFGYYSSWTGGLGKPVSKRDFQRSPRLAIFRKQGLKITHVSQTISAVAATAELAKHLDTETGAPLISLVRHSFETRKGEEQLVDYLQVYYHPDRFQYRMDLEIDKI